MTVTRTRRIAHAHIHVERATRRLKVYKVLSQTMPINLVPKIDKILKICAGLVNLRDLSLFQVNAVKTFNVALVHRHKEMQLHT